MRILHQQDTTQAVQPLAPVPLAGQHGSEQSTVVSYTAASHPFLKKPSMSAVAVVFPLGLSHAMAAAAAVFCPCLGLATAFAGPGGRCRLPERKMGLAVGLRASTLLHVSGLIGHLMQVHIGFLMRWQREREERDQVVVSRGNRLIG
nr:unnamed protein product [Digitaria exilis]